MLFADLKGSMELLADRDPEEARKLLDPVLERMMEAVHRYEGTVNQVMGDGIMALFGAPLAHEDHAVRACYAALRMQESLKRYADDTRRSHGVEVQIRVGLNSGEVVVRAVGSDLRMDYTAVGQTTHLAARMEQLAPPGTVRLTAETVRLAEGYVEVRSLGPIPVKGLPDPIEIFELTGAGTARTRLQAAALRGLTRFVGRDAEVEHLRRVLGQAGAGRGQVVAIVGEAGVGKSRLTYEFTHSHRVQDWLILEASSVSYGKATSYLPVIDLLKGYFKIGDRDDHREMRAKVLGRVLGLDRALEPLLPPLLALLDVPVEDPAWQNLDPPQRRQRTLDAVKRLLLRESQGQPLLVVFEDLHWIDGETQALLDSLVESLGSARLLLLVNYRPEYEHRWGSKTAYSQLRLDSLPAESAAELLAALLGPDPGLAPLTQMLVKRGNPFFLEETVRTLVETGALAGERGAYRLTRPVEALQVPATVQTILAARIDRLPPEEKQLLQAASVIGKDVPYALLAAIAGAAGGGPAAGARASAGGGVPLRDAALPGPGVHLQARADPRRGLRGPPGRAPARAARRGGGRHRAPARRSPRRARGAAGPPRAAGRGVGQGGALPAPGRHQGLPALGQPRGGHLLRAGARRAPAAARASRRDRRVSRHPLRPPQRALPARRVGTGGDPPRRGRSPRGGRRRPAPPRPRAELQGDPVRAGRRLRGGDPGRASRPGHRRVAGGRRRPGCRQRVSWPGVHGREASAARPSGTARPRSR